MATEMNKPKSAKPAPLPAGLLPVEPFPLAALPDALRPWVTDVTERMQCPVDFVAVPLLVASATMAARSVSIRLRRRDDWTEPGNLWAMIVGRPGLMKTPAMSAALFPLSRLEQAASEYFNEAIEEFQRDEQAFKLRTEVASNAARKILAKDIKANVSTLLNVGEKVQPPTRGRYIVNAPTWEKLHALLAENPGGLLMERDELRGWFLDMGREENAEARSFVVSAWSGNDFAVDRITRGTVSAVDMRLSIMGTIQPGPLAHIMRGVRRGGGDDGLIERFLVSWPDDPGEWRDVDRVPDGKARLAVLEAFSRLDAATPETLQAERMIDSDGVPYGPAFLRLDEGAAEMFAEWRADLEKRLRTNNPDSTESALSKFRHHVPAIALTMHLIGGGSGPVAEAAMQRALALSEYFESHMRRLHGSGQAATVKAAKVILEKVRAGALSDPFTVRDAHRPRWSGLTEHEIVVDAVDLLVSNGWLTETAIETGGRRTAVYSLTEGARRG